MKLRGILVSSTRARPAAPPLRSPPRNAKTRPPAPLPTLPPVPSLHVQAIPSSPTTHRINKFPFFLSIAIPPEKEYPRFWFKDASFHHPSRFIPPDLRCGTHVLSVHDKKLILTGRSTVASQATLITSLKRTAQISSRSFLLVPTPPFPFYLYSQKTGC